MGTIRARTTKGGESRYQAVINLKGHRTERATFRRKTDARKWIQNTESAIREHRYFKTAQGRSHTVRELLDRYEQQVLPRLSDGSSRTTHLNYWRINVGHLVLADLTSDIIADHRDLLSQQSTHQGLRRSPSTVNRYLATLSHALSTARKEWRWMGHNPFNGVSKLKEPPHRIRFLSDDEREALLASCKNSRVSYLYPIVLVALSTGMRRGEITHLRWRDLDLNRGAATLTNTKNREARFVPLTGAALDQLKKLSKIRRIDSDLVFPGKDGKHPIDFKEAWATAVTDAGVEDFRFHDLRHTFGSWLVMSGVDLATAQELMGHKTISMTLP